MPISRGLPSKDLEELLSELETGGQTIGGPGPDPELERNQAARILPSAGEFLAPGFSGDSAEDWVPIEVDEAQ